MTPERVAAWTRVEVDREPPAPVFILGFPRSGTTLLDTLLMNMPSSTCSRRCRCSTRSRRGSPPTPICGG